ncbi:MAG: biosynthetic peptidoglycan transglycosylase [Bdellovibrionota bacterium]
MVSALMAAACAAAVFGVQTGYRLYRDLFPDVTVLKHSYPVVLGETEDGNRLVFRFQKNRPAQWRSLGQLPRKVIAAILMAEDSSFFQHPGYSAEAIRAAWEHNQKPGVKIKRGGSTITQQVVKNLFLSREKKMTRKVRELLLAVELERKVSKKRILEIYLNIADWGGGIYGLEKASQRYFQKGAAELSPKEAAILAFMLPNPDRYRYSIRDGELTSFASRRVEAILERMWKTGQISDEEYASTGAASIDEIPSSL